VLNIGSLDTKVTANQLPAFKKGEEALFEANRAEAREQ
jgi:hypothetical protein